MECIIQIIIGIIGLFANSIAISALCGEELFSKFSQLLTCLAIIDNILLATSILEAIREHIYERFEIKFFETGYGISIFH